MTRRWGIAVLVIAVVAMACSNEPDGGSGRVTGAVVVVSGDVVVESFVVKDSDGSSLQFTPARDADLDVDLLRALVVSGDDVTVVYERTDAKDLVAVSVERSG